MKTIPLVLLSALVFKAPARTPVRSRQWFTISARSASGEPLAGVRVFGVSTQTPDVTFDEGVSITNSRGSAETWEDDVHIGISSEGRMAVSFGEDPLVFGQIGTLTLQLVSGTGAPLASRVVRLLPQKDSGPLRPYGEPGVTLLMDQPALTSRLSAKTDATGRVRFSGLPLGVSFGVSAAFSGIKNGHHTDMLFRGDISAGESARLVVSHRCSVSGHVRTPDGRPISRARVSFVYTEYWVGSLDNAPTVVGAARTDLHGAYRISNLPNCEFSVCVVRQGGSEDIVQSVRRNSGKWDPEHAVTVLPGKSVCDVRAKTGGTALRRKRRGRSAGANDSFLVPTVEKAGADAIRRGGV